MITTNEMRLAAMEAIHKAGNGHPGSVLSCVEILHALYFGVMKINPKEPQFPARDRFIMSKGHAVVALYVALAYAGFFPVKELDRINQEGMLGENCNRWTPGIDANTGSLGHGLSLACGIAYAAKLAGKDFRTFVLLGDSECWEGAIWEAAMFAAHHKLRITAIVDRNRRSILGDTEAINKLSPMTKRWEAFGWYAEIADGHNVTNLKERLMIEADPLVIIATTTKGKGVSFMEGVPSWHHGGIDDEQIEQIRRELGTS